MTNGRGASALLGALTAAVLVFASGCGTAAVPAEPTGPVEQPSAPQTLVASPSARSSRQANGTTASGEDNDFVDGANDSGAAGSPTAIDDESSRQVERVAAGFLAASQTRGYPDERDKAYLRRSRQLTTPAGFTVQQRLDLGDGGPHRASNLYHQHLRTTAEVGSVRADIRAPERARATVEYRLLTQRDDDGTWRTVAAGEPRTQVLTLIDVAGSSWLVDSLR